MLTRFTSRLRELNRKKKNRERSAPAEPRPAKPVNAKRSARRRLLAYAVFFVVIFVISYLGIIPRTLSYSAGDVAVDNIIAPKRIVNERLTEELRVQAENMTSPVYDYIVSAYTSSVDSTVSFYSGVASMHEEYLDDAAVAAANAVYSVDLTLEDYTYLIGISSEEIRIMQNASVDAINSIYSTSEVIASHLEAYRIMARDYLEKTVLNPTQTAIASKVTCAYIFPNMILNESATALARQAARDSVYEVVYETGQTIINKGDILTEDDIQLLKDNNILRTSILDFSLTSAGLPALIIVILVIFDMFLRLFLVPVSRETSKLILTAVIFILVLSIGQIGMGVSSYLIPAALLPMCLCMVYDARTAAFFTLFYLPLLGICLSFDTDTAVFVAVSSFTGIINLRKIRSRSDLITAGVMTALANMMMVVIYGLYRGRTFGMALVKELAYALANGAACALMVSIICLIWENVFRKLTPFRLLEMSGANDDLIQELITVAPGTYHHSLMVGNLAEAAAVAVRGDPLLARVGSYYHDIGKVEKPEYFSENQADGKNSHDGIQPEVSAGIIRNHVRDGIAAAVKSKVPGEIVRFIETHHGTSEITFFKHQAEENGYDGPETFRYSGKLPVSREESIVMLADSVEAAARSLKAPDADSLRNIIDRIVDKKISEGQLEESLLTYADINTVKKEFYEALLNIYHQRVAYPNAEEKKEETNENDTGNNI